MTLARRLAKAVILLLLLQSLLLPAAMAQEGVEDNLEIFSWWTSGNEAAAFDALVAAFNALYPDVTVVNEAVVRGGGLDARATLQTRLAAGRPPDSWQTHPGWELFGRDPAPGYVEPLGDLYAQEGWTNVVPQGLRDMVTRNGQPYAVVAGVHRGNGLWYNTSVLTANGIAIGQTLTFDDFFRAADALKANGIPALCLGDSGVWPAAELFENTLLGTVGPDKYLALWNGTILFDDGQVKQAMATFARMFDYVNSDHAELTWDQAVKALADGSCAFFAGGDWAYRELVAAGLVEGTDFGWVSHPGTDGTFVVVAAGFTLPKGAPHPVNARNWLRVIGSKEAQQIFNPMMGSIPARTDVDRAAFGPYQTWAMDSFGRDRLVPSVVHGEAAPPAFQQSLNDAVARFAVDRDVDAFSRALVAAARDAGVA